MPDVDALNINSPRDVSVLVGLKLGSGFDTLLDPRSVHHFQLARCCYGGIVGSIGSFFVSTPLKASKNRVPQPAQEYGNRRDGHDSIGMFGYKTRPSDYDFRWNPCSWLFWNHGRYLRNHAQSCRSSYLLFTKSVCQGNRLSHWRMVRGVAHICRSWQMWGRAKDALDPIGSISTGPCLPALTRRGGAGRWPSETSEIIRSIAEASEVTRQWRTLESVVSGQFSKSQKPIPRLRPKD